MAGCDKELLKVGICHVDDFDNVFSIFSGGSIVSDMCENSD